jgi:hypothetical protein
MDDLIKIALIFLFVVFPLIGQLLKAAKPAAPAQKPRQPQPRPQRAAPGGPGNPAGPAGPGRPAQAHAPRPGQAALHEEIDAFLRRAAQRRGGAPAEPIEIVEPEAVAPAVRRLARPAAPTPKTATLSDTARPAPHPAGRAPSLQPEPLAQRLSTPLSQADEKLESHLHDAFEHQVGSLAGPGPADQSAISQGTDSAVWHTPDEAAAAQRERPAAAGLIDRLRNPASLKEAIVLGEIFRRPGERW